MKAGQRLIAAPLCLARITASWECPAFLYAYYLLRNIASMNSFQFPISVSIILPSLIVRAILRRFMHQVNTFTPFTAVDFIDNCRHFAQIAG